MTKPSFILKAASIVALGLSSATTMAADIDVIGTQTSLNATYGVDTLSGNTTWTADNAYFLTDRLYVPTGVTLTIEPGTKIYSTFDDQGTSDASDDEVGAVIVARGGQLIANGTAAAPIEFTAVAEWEAENGVDSPFDPDAVVSSAPDETTRGLWGGVILLGNAYIAVTDAGGINIGNKFIEGFAPGATDADADNIPDILEYGFDATFPRDDADSSGSLQYISIRHGGYTFGADNEINGLTLGGVGTGTTVEHIEVIANDDDGIEFFGGTVNTKYCAVAFCRDDSFDIDEGHQGVHQFWFTIQNPNTGDNLGEWDGVGGASKSSTDSSVIRSNPQIYNATFIGAGADAFTNTNTGKDNGIFMDDRFNGAVRNSIITDSVNFLTSFASDGDGGAIVFENNTVGEFGRYDDLFADATSILNNPPANYYLTGGVANNGNTAPETAPGFITYTRDGSGNLTALDPRPSTPDTNVSAGAPCVANFRGAFGPSENWLAGWSFLSNNNLVVSNSTDTDGDGVADALETTLGLNPAVANTAGEIEEAVNAAITATEQSLIDLGAIEATIDPSTGDAIIGFELKSSDDLIDFAPLSPSPSTFNVGLPTGKRFYRFEAE